jgi:hypothetical protein
MNPLRGFGVVLYVLSIDMDALTGKNTIPTQNVIEPVLFAVFEHRKDIYNQFP